MNFKVLLLSPPVWDFYATPARREPLGLYYFLGALSEMEEVDVSLFDSALVRSSKTQAWPSEFDYLKEIYLKDSCPFSLFSSYKRYGASVRRIVEEVKKFGADLVAISSLFTGYHPDIEEIIKAVTEQTDALVVVGGWAVEAEAEQLFKESRADFFITGDRTESLKALVESLQLKRSISKVPSLIYRRGREIRTNPPSTHCHEEIDNIVPRPGKYYFHGRRIAKMQIGRGCAHKCEFCSVHRLRRFQIKDFSQIEKELEFLVKEGVEIVNFEDDNLFYNKQWSRQFLDLLRKFHAQGLSFTAMNGITARNLLPFARQAQEAGFIEFNLSLVTGDVEESDKMKRPHTFATIKEIAECCGADTDMIVFLVLGLPGSTPEAMIDDIRELAALPVKIGASPLYLIPGIPMFAEMGLPEHRRLMRGSALYSFGREFIRSEVISLWKLVRLINYLKLHNDDEVLHYFVCSIKEKKWYVKVDGEWLKSDLDCADIFPETMDIMMDDGVMKRVKLK